MGSHYRDVVVGVSEPGDIRVDGSGDRVGSASVRAGSAATDGAAGPSKHFVVAVGVVAVVAAIVRLAYIWFDRRDVVFGGDAFYYHQGANLLADGEGFIHPFGWLDGRSVESADHPPLYIVYLAGWSLMGVRTTTGHMVAERAVGRGLGRGRGADRPPGGR